MSFLKRIFGKENEPIKSYGDFWRWFQKNEKEFYNVVKSDYNIEKNFLDKISAKLEELKEGYFYLTGMCDDNTVELILTADGNTKNIAFVEDLVNSAPKINGWIFTALKPSLDIKDVSIEMDGYKFSSDNISFYANELPEYPDEIDITVVHNDLTDENKSEIENGIHLFLDNYLGELDFVNTIDNLIIIAKEQAQKELIPIAKIKDFLTWRQKEFIEKYEGLRYDTENDCNTVFETQLEDGKALVALINIELLNWDSKASHPWVLKIKINYDGKNNNGMPDTETSHFLNNIEDEIMLELKDYDGYLNIGRQTGDNQRDIYFACKDFRKPSRVLYQFKKSYSESLQMDYDIYKDKYWQSFERFNK